MLFIILNLVIIDIYFLYKLFCFYKKKKLDKIYNSVLKAAENDDIVKSFFNKFGGL